MRGDTKKREWWPSKTHADKAYQEWIRNIDLKLEEGERSVNDEIAKTEITHARVPYFEAISELQLNKHLDNSIWKLGTRFTIGISNYLDCLTDKCAKRLVDTCINKLIDKSRSLGEVSFDKLIKNLKSFGTRMCSLMGDFGPMEECYMAGVGIELLAGIQFFTKEQREQRLLQETTDWIKAKTPKKYPRITSKLVLNGLIKWVSVLKMPKQSIVTGKH